MEMKLELVNVPVRDVDRAIQFYRDTLGFALDHDQVANDVMRQVQLTPPGSACSISLSMGMIDMKPGAIQGLLMVVPNIEAKRTELIERGVDVTALEYFEDGLLAEGHDGDKDTFANFRDPDGNGWILQERPSSN